MSADIVFKALTPQVNAALRPDGGWFVNNAGWVTGTKATLVIDTFASERRTLEMMEAVGMSQTAGVGETEMLLVLTHAHGDHANGAGLVEAAGAAVHASGQACEEIHTLGIQTFPGLLHTPDWGAVSPPKSCEPLTGTHIFDLGGLEAEVTALPFPAHTDGDVYVHLPAERILFAGDLVWNQVTPLAFSGSVTQWIDQLDSLAMRHDVTVVPGHGAVGGPDLIDSTRRYLDWIVSLAQEVIAGTELSAQSLMRRRAGLEWDGWSCPERDLANVPRAVSDIDGQPYDEMSAMSAMRDCCGGLIRLQA
jgi:cyclase